MSDQAQKIVGKSAKSKAWMVPTFSILFCALRGCFMCEEGLEKGLAEKNYRKLVRYLKGQENVRRH
jgi:hypothetical protein